MSICKLPGGLLVVAAAVGGCAFFFATFFRLLCVSAGKLFYSFFFAFAFVAASIAFQAPIPFSTAALCQCYLFKFQNVQRNGHGTCWKRAISWYILENKNWQPASYQCFKHFWSHKCPQRYSLKNVFFFNSLITTLSYIGHSKLPMSTG